MNKKFIASVALLAFIGMVLFVSFNPEALNLLKKHKSLKLHKGNNTIGFVQNSPCETTCQKAGEYWCGPSQVLSRYFCCAAGQTCEQQTKTYGWGWASYTSTWSACTGTDASFACTD